METPTLVLLPGLDGTGDLFGPLISAIGAHFDTLIVRYPTQEALGYAEIEALVRESLPIDKPIVVLGESFSGPIAASIAASPPANLRGVVLCCTFVSNPQPWLSSLKIFAGLVNPKWIPLAVTSLLLMGKHSTPPLRASLAGALAKVAPNAFQARLRAILDVNVSAALGEAKVPVLYLQALQDRLVPASASKQVIEALSAIQIARIDGPHFLLQIHPLQTAKAIHKFIQSLERQSIGTA